MENITYIVQNGGNVTDNLTYLTRISQPNEGSPQPSVIQLVLFYMDVYFTPIIAVLGVIGNTISLIALLKSKLNTFSSSHYLAAICIVNTTYLITPCLKWLNKTRGVNIVAKPGLCQALSFVEDSSIFLSNWYVVAFFVDRYISMCWPTEGMRLCTKVRARIVITGLLILSTVIYINLTITKGVVEHPEKNIQYCRSLPFFNHDIKLLLVIELLLNILLPYACILLLAVFILRRLYTLHRRDSYSEDNSPLLLKHTTFIFLLAYVFLHCPNEIYHAIFYIRLVAADQSIRRSIFEINTQLLLLHAFHLSLTLHIVVFLTTNTIFRNYLKEKLVKLGQCLTSSKCSQHLYGGSANNNTGNMDSDIHGKYDKVLEFTAATSTTTKTQQVESAI